MIKPKGIDHVLINVTDLNRAVMFYTENFGLKASGQYEGAVVWMNFGQYEEKGLFIHDFGLYKVEQDLPEHRRNMAGLNHIAFHYISAEELEKAALEMGKRGVKILKGPGTHKEDNTRYVYIEDPDKNVIELVAPLGENHPKA
ncbi:MAG: VOC family protein [Candidatus Binatia bacterium]|jgi:catechol 2,3-dioxygenase-like lactoylglutathione lyase family enzyme